MRRIHLLPALVAGASGDHARSAPHLLEAAGEVKYVDGSAAVRSFRLGPQLGSGFSGAVFRTRFQRADVAVKISHQGTLSWSDVRGAAPSTLDRGIDKQCNADQLIKLFREIAAECEAMSYPGDGEEYITKCLGHNSSPPMLAALAEAQSVLPVNGAMGDRVPSPFLLVTPHMAVVPHVVTTDTIFPLLISELGHCDGAAALGVAKPQEALYPAVYFSLLRSELAALAELCSRRTPAWAWDTKPANHLVFGGATDPVDGGLAIKMTDLSDLLSPSESRFQFYARHIAWDMEGAISLPPLQYGRRELVGDLTSQPGWAVLNGFDKLHSEPASADDVERARDALKSLRAWASEKVAQFTAAARAELGDPHLSVPGEVFARLADAERRTKLSDGKKAFWKNVRSNFFKFKSRRRRKPAGRSELDDF